MPPKMNVLLFHRIALNQSDLPFLPYKNERNGKKAVTGGYHRKNTTLKETIKKALVEYFYNTNVYACDITRVNEAMETGNINLLDFDEFSEEVINDMAEYINDAIETER